MLCPIAHSPPPTSRRSERRERGPPPAAQCGTVLVGVNATPYGWPAASVDPNSGRRPREPAGTTPGWAGTGLVDAVGMGTRCSERGSERRQVIGPLPGLVVASAARCTRGRSATTDNHTAVDRVDGLSRRVGPCTSAVDSTSFSARARRSGGCPLAAPARSPRRLEVRQQAPGGHGRLSVAAVHLAVEQPYRLVVSALRACSQGAPPPPSQ